MKRRSFSFARLLAITAVFALVIVVIGLAVAHLYGPGPGGLLLGAMIGSALALGLMILVFLHNRSGPGAVVNGAARGIGRGATAGMEAAEQTAQAIRVLLDNLGEAVYLVGADGRVAAYNTRFVELFDLPPDRVKVGADPLELVEYLKPRGEFDRDGNYAIATEAITHCLTQPFEEIHRRPNGQILRVTGRPIPSGGCTVSFIDITEQRATEECLRQATKLEAIGRLTGGVAHDFNNLLAVILGDAELLQERLGTLDPVLRERADSIVDTVDKGAQLVQSLLSFARRQPLTPQPISVNQLITGFAPLLRRTLGEDIDLAVDLSPEACVALADGHQLETALLNLAINARDAMSRGGRLTISTRNQLVDRPSPGAQSEIAPGDYVCLSISDTGCGIPCASLSKVVEPFFTTKPVGKGSGLGLSMVYGFAQQSGGHLAISSEVGLGTTVSLYLPRTGLDQGADRNGAAGADPRDIMPRGTERILLIEDDDRVRDTMLNLLSALGYGVMVAGSGVEALAILKSGQPFDLLFSDIVLPGGMTGVEIAEQAKALLPKVEVMFTSGYSDMALMHEGRLDPGVRLLHKPFRRGDLARTVRAVLDTYSDARGQP